MTSRKNHRIQAVLFDMDDTLIDWSGLRGSMGDIEKEHLRSIHRYLEGQGHQVPEFADFWEQFRDIFQAAWAEAKTEWKLASFATVMQKFLVDCGLDVETLKMDAILQAYGWKPLPGVVPFDDTLDVLAQLKQDNYKIGLVTNAMQPMWMRDVELHAFGILDFLDARVTSGDVGYLKPHPFIYWQTLEMMGVEPDTAVFVGDRPANDIAGANEAGLISVLMAPPHLNRELNGVKPDFTITRLTELLPILEQLEMEKEL